MGATSSYADEHKCHQTDTDHICDPNTYILEQLSNEYNKYSFLPIVQLYMWRYNEKSDKEIIFIQQSEIEYYKLVWATTDVNIYIGGEAVALFVKNIDKFEESALIWK